MLLLKEKYHTHSLTTRSMAREVFDELMHLNTSERILDFSGIEFASRSFMVQLYSMLARHRSQVQFINMNETVERMYQLAVTSYNTPSVMPMLKKNGSNPETMTIS